MWEMIDEVVRSWWWRMLRHRIHKFLNCQPYSFLPQDKSLSLCFPLRHKLVIDVMADKQIDFYWGKKEFLRSYYKTSTKIKYVNKICNKWDICVLCFHSIKWKILNVHISVLILFLELCKNNFFQKLAQQYIFYHITFVHSISHLCLLY